MPRLVVVTLIIIERLVPVPRSRESWAGGTGTRDPGLWETRTPVDARIIKRLVTRLLRVQSLNPRVRHTRTRGTRRRLDPPGRLGVINAPLSVLDLRIPKNGSLGRGG
jgi:hypothetical protein